MSFLFLWGLGQETAEKQQPSALEFVGLMGLAVDDLARASSSKKIPLSQAVTTVVNEFNKKVVVKKWKIDPSKKKIILNLLRCPVSVSKILADHYDAHKHAQSGEGLVGFVLEYIMLRKINLRKLWLLWILMVHKKSKHILIWTI